MYDYNGTIGSGTLQLSGASGRNAQERSAQKLKDLSPMSILRDTIVEAGKKASADWELSDQTTSRGDDIVLAAARAALQMAREQIDQEIDRYGDAHDPLEVMDRLLADLPEQKA